MRFRRRHYQHILPEAAKVFETTKHRVCLSLSKFRSSFREGKWDFGKGSINRDGILDRDRIINYVSTHVTGVPDYDGLDFLQEVINNPHIENEHETHNVFVLRKLKPAVAVYRRDLMINGNSVIVDNRKGTDPMLKNFRIDDFGWRLSSGEDGTVAARIPYTQTHLRSHNRGALAHVCFDEEVGTLIKVMLLNYYSFHNIDQPLTPESMIIPDDIAEKMTDNGRKYWKQLDEAAQQQGISPKRRDLLKRLARDLKESYCDFDKDRLHDKVSILVKDEMELYQRSRDIWGKLQQAFVRHRNKIMVTNLKSDKDLNTEEAAVSIGSIKRNRQYTSEFFSEVNYDVYSNTGHGNIRNIARHGGISSRAWPLLDALGKILPNNGHSI